MISYLKVTVLFKYSMVEAIMLTKLGGYLLNTLLFICGGSSWPKIAVTLTMDLLTDITTGTKGSTIQNTLNLLLPF